MISVLQSKLLIIGGWMSSRLLLVSLEVALFALIVWVVLRFVHFRSARVRGAIWLTVLLKMVFSLFVALPISPSFIPNQDVARQQVLDSSAPLAEQNIPGSHGASSLDEVALWRRLNWQQGGAILWLSGCFLMLGRLAPGLWSLGKIRKNAQPAPSSLQRILLSCKEQLGVRAHVKLQLSDNIPAPILSGFLRPVIMLPSWFAEGFAESELRMMLIHELAHWRYRDTWVLCVRRLMEALFFFHPAIWYASRQVAREAEAACDELVVTLSRESRAYAECLIKTVERARGMKQISLPELAVGGSATFDRVQRLLEEGTSMFVTKLKAQTVVVLALMALLVLPSCLGGSRNAVPSDMIGTWFFDNPVGDNEQMAVFDDGRVIVLYSNGHRDETLYENGFVELAEYDNARLKMTVIEDKRLLQYAGRDEGSGMGKLWRRIHSEPRTDLLKALTGPGS
jgi:beta-lactamase regulating signal transducer with metallopeptidase domain